MSEFGTLCIAVITAIIVFSGVLKILEVLDPYRDTINVKRNVVSYKYHGGFVTYSAVKRTGTAF